MKRAVILFLVSFNLAWALEIPPRPQGTVSDYAELLSPQARATLEANLAQFEKETSNQIIVVTFESLEEESLEDFSIRLAEAWKIGQKDKDNGVIFLIFKNDRQMRIEVGYGLEGVLPDITAGMIISQVVVPRFKQGEYDLGVQEGVAAIMAATQGEFQADVKEPLTDATLYKWLLWGILATMLIDVGRYSAYRASHRGYKDRYSFWEWLLLFSILLFMLKMMAAARGHGGGGGNVFSGGGGSFGGGGASGRW